MASRDDNLADRRPSRPGSQDTSRSAHIARIYLESRDNLHFLEQLRDLGILQPRPRPRQRFTVTYRTPTAADIPQDPPSEEDLLSGLSASNSREDSLNQGSDNRGPLNKSSCSQDSPSHDSLKHDTSSDDSSSDGPSRHDHPSSFNPYEQGSRGADPPEESYIKGESSDIISSIENPISELSQMPYNNAAIPPPEEITGQASLPLARVKKILNIDEDTNSVSNNAAFVITIATEMFIRYLAEQAMNVSKLEKKPRRNIQYKDLANAVARIDNLQFLEDVIPRTTTYREYKAKKASKAATQGPQPLQNGQTTIDGSRPLAQRPIHMPNAHRNTTDDANMSDATIDETPTAQTRHESIKVNGNAGLVFEHYEPNGTSKRDESGDVEMK